MDGPMKPSHPGPADVEVMNDVEVHIPNEEAGIEGLGYRSRGPPLIS